DLLTQNTSKDVGGAASRVWNDNLDGSRSLRPRTGQSEKDRKNASCHQTERWTAGKFHDDAPRCVVSLPASRGRFESFASGEVRFWHIASVQREASIRSLLQVKRTYRERTGASPRL